MKRAFMIFPVMAIGVTAFLNEAHAKVALAQIRIKVIDQDGYVVPDAKIWGGFTCGNRMNDYVLVDGLTNANGEFVAQGNCNEFLRVNVTKDGYYNTEEKVNFLQSTANPRVKDGKWQPYGETRKVVLKKIRNPWAAKAFVGDEYRRKIPAFDEWLPFDMGKSDWISPYGSGSHNDVLLRFKKKETDKWNVYSYSMEACFTNNPYAGFYIKSLDEFSDLKTDYNADTNADYRVNYTFSKECVEKNPAKITGLEPNRYLVFRTRTRVDKKGNLIGAHYGKYCRGWDFNGKEMLIGDGCFNPVENDPNIEGDHPLLRKIKNYKK